MAEAAVAWWEEMKAWEDLKDSITNEIRLVAMRMVDKDFLSGLSEAERAAKLDKAKEEETRLGKILTQHLYARVKKPDFSCMTESDRALAAERLREKELERAHLFRAQGRPYVGPEKITNLLDFDPKQGGLYYNRYAFVDLQTFDLDEESPFGPMSCTCAINDADLCGAVNILSVKIASSDVGFRIHVYGTVIVRDSLDERCVYNFRRSSDHCQLIKSKAESLILTGPKRGLALLDDIYAEIDLKIKDHLGQHREFSKGIFNIRGLAARSLTGSMVETKSLATRLSTVDVTYSVIKHALEGTIAFEVLQGGFHGKITACTSSVEDEVVLYDSEDADALTVDDCGEIQLMRSVVSVNVKDLVMIVARTSDGKSQRIVFNPRVNRGEDDVLTVGATKMRVKVFWSAMDP